MRRAKHDRDQIHGDSLILEGAYINAANTITAGCTALALTCTRLDDELLFGYAGKAFELPRPWAPRDVCDVAKEVRQIVGDFQRSTVFWAWIQGVRTVATEAPYPKPTPEVRAKLITALETLHPIIKEAEAAEKATQQAYTLADNSGDTPQGMRVAKDKAEADGRATAAALRARALAVAVDMLQLFMSVGGVARADLLDTPLTGVAWATME